MNFLNLAPSDLEISTGQTIILSQAVAKVKETITRHASEHRDLHSSVSKVGKTIDRVFFSYCLIVSDVIIIYIYTCICRISLRITHQLVLSKFSRELTKKSY